MRSVPKPWGSEVIWAETEKYLGKILLINPGQRLSLQYHEKKEETIYVLEGKLFIWLDEKESNKLILNVGSAYHVQPGQVHRFGAPENCTVKLIEVSTPEIDDVIRIKDDYKR